MNILIYGVNYPISIHSTQMNTNPVIVLLITMLDFFQQNSCFFYHGFTIF
jgi:hypothetical protein